MFGPVEAVVVLVLVLVLFGAGRLPQVMSQLGQGVKALREGQREDEDEDEEPSEKEEPPAKPR